MMTSELASDDTDTGFDSRIAEKVQVDLESRVCTHDVFHFSLRKAVLAYKESFNNFPLPSWFQIERVRCLQAAVQKCFDEEGACSSKSLLWSIQQAANELFRLEVECHKTNIVARQGF